MTKQITMAMVLALGATTAMAQPKDSMKKAPDKADMKMRAPEPKAPAPSGPPAEVAAMAKMMAGNWKCKGKGAMDPMNPTVMTDFTGTYKAALDLDKYWVKGEWKSTAGKLKMNGVMYVTYDAAAKKWYRMSLDNMGMSGTEWSAGLPAGATDGKMVWEGDMRMGGMTMKGRTTEEVAAKEVKMTGEMSMDGKKWMVGMEMTCKK